MNGFIFGNGQLKSPVQAATRRLLVYATCAACLALTQTTAVHSAATEYADVKIATIAPGVTVDFELFQDGFSNPTFITHANDSRLFVVEQGGLIKVIKGGTTLSTPFLNLTDLVQCCGEEGLLGLAFEPNYQTTGRFYVYYTNKQGDQVIARYQVSANVDIADDGSAQILMTIPHPDQGNHNGGWLGFGPDNNLYAGVGDGGGGGDPFCAAQNPSDWRGKILRLSVLGQATYTSPAGNVFTTTQKPEVWAIGLRNPWRASFDRQTGDLYIGDVGQGKREEISYAPAGASAGLNFGWSQFEGNAEYSDGISNSGPHDCSPSGIAPTQPITDYGRSLGTTVTGGYVYRGQSYPWLAGTYFYADFGSGNLWAAWKSSPTDPFSTAFLQDTGYNISTFGEDVNGELYIASYSDGTLYKLTSTQTITNLRPQVYMPLVMKQ